MEYDHQKDIYLGIRVLWLTGGIIKLTAPKQARTVEEINEKIRTGDVQVLTVAEMKELVESSGIKVALDEVDVVTTGTMGELTPVLEADGRTIGDGQRGDMTRRLQALHREFAFAHGTPLPF